MKHPETPAEESQRLQALRSLEIIYTPSEERYDRITRIAKRLFNVPIVLVSLVTQDKQWFKSRQGLSAAETGRQISFCGHAILSDQPFVVPNAMKDPDFRDNPLVTGPPDIRFYAGQPLHFDGFRIGTLCIIDTKPRHLRPADYDSLRSLAHWVEIELQDWHRSKNSFLQQVLKLENRESLLDSVTGNLNTVGIQRFLEKISDQEIPTQRLALDFEHGDKDESEHEQLRIKIADALRTLVADAGIIGFAEPDRFHVFLIEQAPDAVERLTERVRTGLGELQAADASGPNWSWQLHEV